MKVRTAQSDSIPHLPAEFGKEVEVARLLQNGKTQSMHHNSESEESLDKVMDDHAAQGEMSDELIETEEVRRDADLNSQ